MNIFGTLLDISGKTKDSLNARCDLADLKIQPELTPINGEKKIFIPPACYTLTKKEKRFLLKSLSKMKVPWGYSSNVTNLVSIEDSKLNGLNSHDCHVLLQQLLPVAIRFVLPKHVRYAITRFCLVFNSICNKVIDVTQVEKLQENIVMTLCLLEKYFPPSFFTIMIHLTVHLVREVKLCGPIYLRWMYPFERFMKVIKNAVRNRNRPEGCIAEGYILEEAVEFCSEFLCGVDPIGLGCQKLRDNSDYSELGRPLSSGVTSIPERELLYQAHRYVLENTVDVQPYIEKHLIALQQQHRSRSKNQKWIQDKHNRTFISWLREKVETELATEDVEVSDNLRWIAHGPHPVVTTYNSYAINGCHYHTKSHDKNKTVQNSGIHSYTMELPTDEDLTLGLDEVEIGLDNAHTDHLEQVDASKNEKKNTRGLTLMHDVTRIKTMVANHGAFVVDGRSKKAIMKTAGVSFRQFKSWLTTQYIIPFMDEPQLLIDPPLLYAYIIDKPVWQEFVRSRMFSEFQDEILDKAPNEESPNDALTQALGTPEYGRREKILENIVKEKKGIATSVPPVSLTSKKKVVEEEEVKEEEVIATTPMTKNEVKSSRPMTKEVEVTSEPSNLPIQLKYILRYAERKVSKYVFVDPSLISAGHSTREIRARNLCSRLMTSKQDQLVVAPYNPGALTIFQSQKNLKKTRKTTFWKAVGTVECGYYVMRYMREIVSKDTSIITDAIDTRNLYSQLELDEV
ncbi:transposase [Cucumis melo var. makuwa]|uniref:Transposase n=1 Tax=Cucumis melo var. makuwa TaxID=1194695 RepID=A0A5A7UMJ5_CUCMM|nr:transposase [Cucumis melo var. makuwa]